MYEIMHFKSLPSNIKKLNAGLPKWFLKHKKLKQVATLMVENEIFIHSFSLSFFFFF
jgi:hypothetical protein